MQQPLQNWCCSINITPAMHWLGRQVSFQYWFWHRLWKFIQVLLLSFRLGNPHKLVTNASLHKTSSWRVRFLLDAVLSVDQHKANIFVLHLPFVAITCKGSWLIVRSHVQDRAAKNNYSFTCTVQSLGDIWDIKTLHNSPLSPSCYIWQTYSLCVSNYLSENKLCIWEKRGCGNVLLDDFAFDI